MFTQSSLLASEIYRCDESIYFLNLVFNSVESSADCEWKAQAGNVCIASFDWSCSGICKSVEKIKFVHEKCGEGDAAVWGSLF